ncbi:MAG TPA: CBS domain-containing protein [Candidatus Saccharimonadales bacterium]|nr:CBS domain-containing protein [Candidatus Saccharimonadales bacterium]
MLTFIIALVLLGIALFGILMRKTYDYMPYKELKRQARQDDPVAKQLYRAVAYGADLRLLLWAVIGLSAAGGFVLFVAVAPPLLAFMAVAGLLWYGFVWMPAAPISSIGARMVVAVTPLVAKVLGLSHPLLNWVTRITEPKRAGMYHTGLYEREDLIAFLELQREMADSRIDDAEIDMAIHALTFGDRLVHEVMIPKRAVKMVRADETVGPILMDELHDSGYSRFPVYERQQDTISGILYLRDLLGIRHGDRVHAVMRRDVYYVHEDQDLYHVLHAFMKTKHHLFIVVNSFEEFVGIVTIEDVLEQVIGAKIEERIEDEFNRYDDPRAVAAAQEAKAGHKARHAATETPTVVVE